MPGRQLDYTALMKVVLTPAAQDDFVELPLLIQVRVLGVLQRLEKWPAVSGGKPLRAI
jgi:hypothetical protein